MIFRPHDFAQWFMIRCEHCSHGTTGTNASTLDTSYHSARDSLPSFNFGWTSTDNDNNSNTETMKISTQEAPQVVGCGGGELTTNAVASVSGLPAVLLNTSRNIHARLMRPQTPLAVLMDPTFVCFTAIVFFFHVANGPVLPIVIQSLSLHGARASILLSGMCIFLGQVPVALFANLAGDYSPTYGRKGLLLMGLFSLAVRYWLLTGLILLLERVNTTTGIYVVETLILSTQLLDSVGAGIFGTMYIIITNDIAGGTGRFSFMMGTTTAAMSLGGTVSGYIGHALAQDYGYAASFSSLGIMSLIPFRQLGDVEWERAFVVDGTDRLYIDFANPAKTLWEENSFGYANIEWDIGNTLTADGNHELMVETVCTADPNLKSAPDNFNGYAAIPITGVMDRKIPKRYGSPLPLGDIVIPGEEIAVMFSEPILCEQPYRFDINVTVSGIPGYFDERNLNIFCSGRKLAFQFDQTNIGYDELMGRDMNVTINKVSDRHLIKMNELDPIDFSKTLVNLNLAEVTTSFQFTVDDDCDGSVDGKALQNQIAGILALPEPSRIDIQSAVCNNDGTIVATVMIGPALAAGALRRKLSKADEDAITLVHKLMGKTDTRNGNDGKVGSQRRVLANGKEFHVGPMRITPGSGDKKLLDTHPDLQLEEEMIRSGGETLLLQKKRIHLMENKLEGDIDEVLEALKLERQELHLVEMVLACGFVGGSLLLLAATCFL